MQVTNLAYFYETARKVRGGKFVWWKDGNGEARDNVLLGGTILNPNKGFGHLWAAQLVEYRLGGGCLIFRSFKTKTDTAANATTVVIDADGFSDAPEVGMYVMVAPDSLEVETTEYETTESSGTYTTTATTTKTDYTGTYAKITAVVYDAANEKFTLTLENKLSTSKIDAGTILVEADAASDVALDNPTGVCEVLVPNPNTFVEADRDLLPTQGYGIENANYSISTVSNKKAFLARMQPLPKYVLDKNRSYIDGVFWI